MHHLNDLYRWYLLYFKFLDKFLGITNCLFVYLSYIYQVFYDENDDFFFFNTMDNWCLYFIWIQTDVWYSTHLSASISLSLVVEGLLITGHWIHEVNSALLPNAYLKMWKTRGLAAIVNNMADLHKFGSLLPVKIVSNILS